MASAYRSINKGSLNESIILRFLDETTGVPQTGVTPSSQGFSIKYRRENGALSSNFVTGTMSSLTGTHVDGLMGHIDEGFYLVNSPDAAFADGSSGVLFVGACSGMIADGCYVPLTDALEVDANGYVSANVVEISNDSVAADNLELAFQNTLAEPTGPPNATDPLWIKLSYLFASVMNQVTVASGSSAVKTFYTYTGAPMYTKGIYDNGTVYTESGAA